MSKVSHDTIDKITVQTDDIIAALKNSVKSIDELTSDSDKAILMNQSVILKNQGLIFQFILKGVIT